MDPNGPPGHNTIVIMPSFSHGSHCASHSEKSDAGWWEFMVGPGKVGTTGLGEDGV